MGLFSSKKIINVSSTLYNMAGPEDERPDYLKGTLFASVLSNSESLGSDIVKSYLTGPGIKQRQFFKYCDRNDVAGLPDTTITNNASVDPAIVAAEIPVNPTPPGQEITVTNSQMTDGDPEPFFVRWILENHPARVLEEWLGDFDPVLDEFSVQFPNGDFFTFVNPGYDTSKRYIEARYLSILADDTQPLNEGTPVTVTALADLTGYFALSSTGTVFVTTLVRSADVVEVFSDGITPSNLYTEDASVDVSLNRSIDVWERTELTDVVGLQTQGLYERYTYTGDDQIIGGYSAVEITIEDLGGGETKTITRTITGDQADTPQWIEKFDDQIILESTVIGGDQLFIYEIGSGNANLDALATTADASNFQEFYPFLPLRLDNKSIEEAPYDTNGLFTETKAAYRKATTKGIDKILEQIDDNDSIDDIDYAYIMYGVSLNVQENACRKYIFKFFEKMIPFQNSNSATIGNFQTAIADHNTAKAALEVWLSTDWDNQPWSTRPPRPVVPALNIPSTTTIKLKTSSSLMPSFDMRLQWVHLDDVLETGTYTYTPIVGSPRPAKKGEVFIVKGTSVTWQESSTYNERDFVGTNTVNKEIDSVEIYWQISDNSYRKMTVYGMVHQNFIYGGKSVKITGHEALDDDDISGFVIPLHYPTIKELSIVDYTQMATADTHILFNSYTVTKQKWYQSGIFKILLIILIIVIAVTINPGAFAAGSGLLGVNAAVGAAIGLTGTAAIVAGVVANYLAALIVSQVLTAVGSKLFGEEFGALFAAIVGIAIGVVSGTFQFDAAGLLQIGSAVANGYAGFVAGEIGDLNAELEEEQSDYDKQMDYINDLISGLGGNNLNFNPLFLTDSVRGNDSGQTTGYLPETPDEFIRRTTMVGSDIVNITQSMVYDYVDVQRTLPRN